MSRASKVWLRQARASWRRRRGFTLLEVLVALAIFALAAVVLGAAYVNVLNSYALASRDRGVDEDASFAYAQLLAEPDRKKAEEGGEFESAGGRRVRWTARIEDTTVADLFAVTFECEASEPLQETQKITRSFMLLRPTWSDAGERERLRAEARVRIEERQLEMKR